MIPYIHLDCEDEWPNYYPRGTLINMVNNKDARIQELEEELEEIKGRIAWWVETQDAYPPLPKISAPFREWLGAWGEVYIIQAAAGDALREVVDE